MTKTAHLALRVATLLATACGLAACSYVDRYEAAVYDLEPRYCYQTLAKVECYDKPYARYAEHLVNYQGPHPSRYPEPVKAETPALKAPAPVNYWVKDAEPIPHPSPVGYRQGSLPWLEQPVRPATPSGEEEVSDSSLPGASGDVPLASPAPAVASKPTLRAPSPRSPVPLANPDQGYYLNSGTGGTGVGNGSSAGLGVAVAPAS